MVEVMKSSFIPKKEIKRNANKKKGSSVGVFFLISLVVFLSTVIGGAGMYFWQSTLKTEIKVKNNKLEESSENYGVSAFEEFINIDKKIQVADELLKKHYAVRPIYTFLDKNTIPDVVFTKMTLKEDGKYVLTEFSGKASQFSDLVRQKDLYTQNPNIRDFLFSDITRSKEENMIIFNMSFRVDKKWLTTNKLIKE